MSDYETRQLIAQKQQAVSEALADLLSVQGFTEAHNFVVTLLSTLAGAVLKKAGRCLDWLRPIFLYGWLQSSSGLGKLFRKPRPAHQKQVTAG